MIDTRLSSLLKILETGSYTKAAEALSLSQPAVSQHIRQLEETYGVKIFERVHNRLQLTPEGEILAGYARRIAALDRQLEQELKNEREQVRSLTIGITHSAESSAIIEALAAYSSEIPGLSVKIITNTTDKLCKMLNDYELDFAFIEGTPGDPALRSMMLDTDCLVLAVPPEHPFSDRTTVTIPQLKKEKLILRLPNSNTRDLFEASLESLNLRVDDFNVIMEIDSIATIKDLIRRGFGVSVLARSACMDEVKKGKLSVLTIENLSMMRQINLVYSPRFEHPELLQGIVKKYNEMQRR